MKIDSLKSIAYDYIKGKILRCEIRGGERIWGNILADELEMSRTPVREAIHQLVIEGLVLSEPRKGLSCVEMTEQEVNELCDLRLIYEKYAIEKCIEKCKGSDIELLKRLCADFDNTIENSEKIAVADDCLHEKIIDFTENQQLIVAYARVKNFIHIIRVMTGSYVDLDSKLAKKEHWDLIDCIEKKDLDSGIDVIKIHVNRIRSLPLKKI